MNARQHVITGCIVTDTPFHLKETLLVSDDVDLVQNKHIILVLKVVSATL